VEGVFTPPPFWERETLSAGGNTLVSPIASVLSNHHFLALRSQQSFVVSPCRRSTGQTCICCSAEHSKWLGI